MNIWDVERPLLHVSLTKILFWLYFQDARVEHSWNIMSINLIGGWNVIRRSAGFTSEGRIKLASVIFSKLCTIANLCTSIVELSVFWSSYLSLYRAPGRSATMWVWYSLRWRVSSKIFRIAPWAHDILKLAKCFVVSNGDYKDGHDCELY